MCRDVEMFLFHFEWGLASVTALLWSIEGPYLLLGAESLRDATILVRVENHDCGVAKIQSRHFDSVLSSDFWLQLGQDHGCAASFSDGDRFMDTFVEDVLQLSTVVRPVHLTEPLAEELRELA